MSLTLIGIAIIVLLFVLIFLNMPVGISLALSGTLGICLVRGIEPGLSLLSAEYFRTSTTYSFSVIPFFIAMGFLAAEIELSSDAFKAINKWVGHFRGGLAMATTIACAVFAAICGDALATAITICAVSLPTMRAKRYADSLSLGCLAAGGNLGFLIPPSLGFILYGILTEQSVGTLFMAGIGPGILMTLLFLITIWIICYKDRHKMTHETAVPLKEKIQSLKDVISSIVLIVVVLGGIYAGLFTPTEAGAVGLFGVIVIGLVKKKLVLRGFLSSIQKTAGLVGRIFILISGAIIFSRFIVVTEIPLHLAEYIININVPALVILVVVLLFYILIGFVMDIMSVILLSAPIIHPMLVGLGYDPVWLAAITIVTICIGHISPPVGIVVFGLSGYVRDVPIFTIYRGAMPYVAAMIVCLILCILFPSIVLYIPKMMSIG